MAAALFTLVPVAVDPLGLFPFGPLKWALISTGLVAAGAWWLLQPEAASPRSALVVWMGMGAWGIVSAVSSLDPLHAWIGTPDRRLGLFAFFLFGLAFVIGSGCGRYLRRLAAGAILGLAGVGLIALAELAGWEPVALTVSSPRVGGPLGSPAYLGAFCVLALPLTAGFILNRDESGGWRLGAGAAAAVGIVALLASQTRSALLGAGVGLVLLLPALTRRIHWWWLAGAAVVLVALVAITPAGRRGVEALDLGSEAWAGRLAEWEVGWRVLTTHPLVGVGPEGYRVAFPLAVDEDYEARYGRRVIPDRAHNGALDVGLALGVPGLLAYLVGAGWLLWRAGRGASTREPLKAGLSAAVAGYLVQQQFLFQLAELDPLFWILAGALVAATTISLPSFQWRSSRLLVGMAAAATLVLAGAGVLEVVADRMMLTAYRLEAGGNPTAAIATARRAAGLRPDSIRTWLVAADLASRGSAPQASTDALVLLESALRLSPGDPALRATRARLLLARAQSSANPTHLDVALAASADLLSTDPVNAQHHLSYGNALILAGDFAGAESEWRRAERLAPSSAVPAMNLTRLYLEQGRTEEATASYRRAVATDPGAPGLGELAALLAEAGVAVENP